MFVDRHDGRQHLVLTRQTGVLGLDSKQPLGVRPVFLELVGHLGELACSSAMRASRRSGFDMAFISCDLATMIRRSA